MTLSCAACSQPSDQISLRPQGSDPANVAAALSLGGRLSQDLASKYQNAIDCATALRTTADRLVPVATGSTAKGVEVVKRAASYYRDRAVETDSSGTAAASVDSAIAQGIREKRADTAAQAQLSIACLRALQSKA